MEQPIFHAQLARLGKHRVAQIIGTAEQEQRLA
jgi:hypothetical protein